MRKPRHTVRVDKCYYQHPLAGRAAVPCAPNRHHHHVKVVGFGLGGEFSMWMIGACCRCDDNLMWYLGRM